MWHLKANSSYSDVCGQVHWPPSPGALPPSPQWEVN